MKQLLQLVIKFQGRKRIIGLLLFTTAYALLEAASVGAVMPYITFIQSRDTLASSALWQMIKGVFPEISLSAGVALLSILLLLLFVSKNILALVQFRHIFAFTQTFYSRISTTLLANYMLQPFEFFLKANSSILSKNVTSETRLVAEQIIQPFVTIISETLVLVFILGVLFVYNPLGSAVTVVTITVVLGGLYHFTSKATRKLGSEREVLFSRMTKVSHEALSGIRDIKVSGSERFFYDAFRGTADRIAYVSSTTSTMLQLPKIVVETVIVSAVLILIAVFESTANDTSRLISILVVYLVAAYRLMPSASRIITAVMNLKYIQAGFQTIAPMLDNVSVIDAQDSSEGSRTAFNNIELRNVRYRYPDKDEDVLKGVTLRIDRGESIGIIGSTGAGKSTLINVLLGLLPVSSGEIRVNGDFSDYERYREYRGLMAYVPQHVFIADDTIERNIALGIPQDRIDKVRLAEAVKLSELHTLCAQLSEGLQTYVGDRGARLSGGQIQRIGLARALYRNAQVLVLDEATSALDVETERRIMNNLASTESDRTVIMIAHRHRSLSNCNRIIEIADGTIGEEIDYEDLIARNNHQGI